jgi:RimJ/RimL family protein N-acetyltransferase
MIEKIESETIILRKFSKLDKQPIYDAIKKSYTDIVPWASWLHPEYSLNDAEKFVDIQLSNWESNEEFSFTIKDDKEHFLGVINLHVYDQNNDVASIGYWMNSQYTNRGFCTEALKLLVDSSFKILNLNRIEVIVALSNIASQRVAEKAGAIMESVQKNRVSPNGFPQDAKMYVFIPPILAHQ